jgi:hypothetical protein
MFSQPKKTQDGRYYVKPTDPKLIQLNGVKIVSVSQDTVTLSLDENAQNVISAIDVSNLEAAKANCESWFSRVVQEKTLEAAYMKSYTDGVMNVSKPTFHRVYRGKELTDDQPVDGDVCDVVIDFTGITFSKKTFGPVWKILQTRLKVPPKKKYHEEYLFQDDTDPVEASDEDLFE